MDVDDGARDDLLEDLGAETYVSLVTYRRDGSERATPVWLVRDRDALRVATGAGTAKVRRARRDRRGTITPCDARGRLPPGAVTTAVSVEVREGPVEVRRTEDLLRRKHPLGFRLLTLGHGLGRLVPGRAGHADVTLLLRPLPAPA